MAKRPANPKKEKWRLYDTIVSGGLFGLFADSEEARQKQDGKKFNQLVFGSLLGIVFTVALFYIVL
ncbi:hypothetical protein [Alkalihalobacterium bogoriense]|uniref:hypothetical protein n=1 Tax=Alkalihalobacterium bogoriense TaxID=246272 RepID=UPI0005529A33|nr:hypothetical protein [Alkalihalobacterium bogoriense]